MNKISTRVTKILEKNHINYKLFTYAPNSRLTGLEIAAILNEDPKTVFKTLLTKTYKNKYYILVIPVNKELDLKKCAKFLNEKDLNMAHEKEMLPITGYIHGGCSPIGLAKANTKIYFDSSSLNYSSIFISAGEVGKQIQINTNDLRKIINFDILDLTK